MRIFQSAIEKHGGPLPLASYLQPQVESRDAVVAATAAVTANTSSSSREAPGATTATALINAANTFIDRKNFFDAVLNDADFALVTTFLMGGVPIDTRRAEDGATALHVAAAETTQLAAQQQQPGHRRGHVSFEEILDSPCPNQLILSFLIDNGADINAQMTSDGETPLMLAARAQNVRGVQLLLAKGASVAVRDHAGHTCLAYAAPYPHVLLALQVWVGEADMARMAQEEYLLHHVCREAGNRFAALFLIEQLGMDVNAREGELRKDEGAANDAHNDSSGSAGWSSPSQQQQAASLTSAASSSSPHATAPVTLTGVQEGYTPLHCAITAGDVSLVKALLSKGADLHAADVNGMTPLQLAHAIAPTLRQSVWKTLFGRGPASLSAAAAAALSQQQKQQQQENRGKRKRHSDVNRTEVRMLLSAYARRTNPRKREALLGEAGVSLRDLNSMVDVVQFVLAMTWPHLFMLLSCALIRNFYVLLLPVVAIGAAFLGALRSDEKAVYHRPLRSLGWFVGFTLMQALCLPLYTTFYYYKYYDFEEEEHNLLVFAWLIPSAVLTAVLLLYTVLAPTATFASSAGQRKGIYHSLTHAKGTPSPELVHGVDLMCMVKKPLRAQRCPHLQQVVLRYDHYCAYLATSIAAHNHRSFFFGHLALLSLLSVFYYYAREYDRVMQAASALLRHELRFSTVAPSDQAAIEQLTKLPFSTTYFRFGYMYTQVILPVMLLLVFTEVFRQFSLIARSLTVFDLEHATTESSVYCFELNKHVYSLFDQGSWANLSRFFACREDFRAVQYRVPTMPQHLQKVVAEYQRWKMTTSGGGCECEHGHGGHDRGSHGPSNNGDGGGGGAYSSAVAAAAAASAPGASSAAAAVGSTGGAANGVMDTVSTAEVGDSEADAVQRRLEAAVRTAAREAVAAVQQRPGTTAAAEPVGMPPLHSSATIAATATSAQSGLVSSTASPAATAATRWGGGGGLVSTNNTSPAAASASSPSSLQQTQQQQEEGGAAGGGGGGAVPSLTQYIFQEMVRAGRADITPAFAQPSTAAGAGAPSPEVQEWEAAVVQAKAMYAFFQNSMNNAVQQMQRRAVDEL